jgi:hypothetical protein
VAVIVIRRYTRFALKTFFKTEFELCFYNCILRHVCFTFELRTFPSLLHRCFHSGAVCLCVCFAACRCCCSGRLSAPSSRASLTTTGSALRTSAHTIVLTIAMVPADLCPLRDQCDWLTTGSTPTTTSAYRRMLSCTLRAASTLGQQSLPLHECLSIATSCL